MRLSISSMIIFCGLFSNSWLNLCEEFIMCYEYQVVYKNVPVVSGLYCIFIIKLAVIRKLIVLILTEDCALFRNTSLNRIFMDKVEWSGIYYRLKTNFIWMISASILLKHLWSEFYFLLANTKWIVRSPRKLDGTLIFIFSMAD